jgi:hypothetical protein
MLETGYFNGKASGGLTNTGLLMESSSARPTYEAHHEDDDAGDDHGCEAEVHAETPPFQGMRGFCPVCAAAAGPGKPIAGE